MTDLEIAMLTVSGNPLCAKQASMIEKALQSLVKSGYLQAVNGNYMLTGQGHLFLTTTPPKKLHLARLRAEVELVEANIHVMFRNPFAAGLDIPDRAEDL